MQSHLDTGGVVSMDTEPGLELFFAERSQIFGKKKSTLGNPVETYNADIRIGTQRLLQVTKSGLILDVQHTLCKIPGLFRVALSARKE